MNFFEKFTETVFYKRDSELEVQIEALKKVINDYPDDEKLKHKLKICELGLKGENEIEFELKNANLGMYVLRDVNLKYKDNVAQIDYLIFTAGYIYFVECKNLIGNIEVNERGEFIREYRYGNKIIKEGIYSPLRQAERHVEVFKKIYDERHIGLIDKIFKEKRQSWLKPLVVMANSKNILNLKKAPKDIKDRIIRSDSLVDYIKKDIKSIDKDYLSNKKDMKENAFSIMQNYNQEIIRDYEKELRDYIKDNKKDIKIKSTIRNQDDLLKEQLVLYRKNKSKEKGIPAYYIFNNEELVKLLELKPKTIEELRKNKVLSDVKINTHGKEIIAIISKL